MEGRCTTISGTIDPYFDWLCSRAKITPLGHRYFEMAKTMHGMRWRHGEIKTDDNRANDGLMLRVEYMEKFGPKGSSTDRGQCTMFEFLVAIAKRMNFIMGDEHDSHRTALYFWALIKNLGLEKCSDENWYSCEGEFRVIDAMNRILDRTYNADGSGGLFPLRWIEADQRKLEIWYQMQCWLTENAENLLE